MTADHSRATDTTATEALLQRTHAQLQLVRREMHKLLIGQDALVEKMLIALIADGHVLLEGVPGLAKTTAVKALAQCLAAQFSRIQFTPDLLPADLIGTQIFSPQLGDFRLKKGPVFCNVLLADEISRAPSKVQSALLEAMQERQVTIGEETFALPKLFWVLATQNPLDQEGTYPLPEAQMDRFLFKLRVDYPSRDEEKIIMQQAGSMTQTYPNAVINMEAVQEARALAATIYLDAHLENYILDIVIATRQPIPAKLKALAPFIRVGASPRASIGLVKAAKCQALLAGQHFVTPQDIKTIAPDVLRHRLILSYEAEADHVSSDAIVAEILNTLPVP